MTTTDLPFYITTPIYYINAEPHLGHAYTTVVCDVLARSMRLRGRDVRFLTGTDEHGEKVQRAAEDAGLEPRRHADLLAAKFREAWKLLDVSHDDFIRTTEQRHVRGAQELWRRIAEAGDIYKGSYSGPYCVGCESYYTEAQLADGRCPVDDSHAVETMEEESYFFRLSKYQEPLLELYRSRPDFIQPRTRLNEAASFVEMGLSDLSISRTKLSWGVPVPDDPTHVMYVWIDALANYVTALGFGGEDPARFERYWPSALHVLAKDILRHHAVLWPAFLMSAGLPLPKKEIIHGYLLMDDQKMSKTRGNIADPRDLVAWFGADAVRYFLLREVPLGSDGSYSEEALIDRINADLANDLGNTLARVTRILTKDLGGRVPPTRRGGVLSGAAAEAWRAHLEAMDAHRPQAALKATWTLLSETNKYLVAEAPWKLAKQPEQRNRLEEVMHEAAEALRHVAAMVAPVMPTTAREIWRRLGIPGDPFAAPLIDGAGEVSWSFPDHGEVRHEAPLFPRIDKVAFFAQQAQQPAAGEAPSAPEDEDGAGLVQYADFAKVSLRSAKVVACRKHPDPKVEKLLVLELDDGTDTPRTICAGIAAYHAPEELVGRTIVVVANLAPRKLRGVESQGMLLAANYEQAGEERVRVVTLPDDVPAGAEVR